MTTMMQVSTVLLLVFCAAVSDLKTHRIPNVLTIPGIFIGGVINTYYYGWNGILNSVVGSLVPMALLIFFMLRMLGAGDIKLFMGIGAILGWKLCLFSMALSFFLGGIAALYILITRRNGKARLKRLYTYVMITAGIRRFEPYDTMNPANTGYLSLGLCIAIGTAATLILNYHQLLTNIFKF